MKITIVGAALIIAGVIVAVLILDALLHKGESPNPPLPGQTPYPGTPGV